jgi:HEAT repeat protein
MDAYHAEYYEMSVPWYYLAPAGDARSYDLLVKGLRSNNLMIVARAAHGLARLQDRRAISELIAAGNDAKGEALWGIIQALTYFDDGDAQSAAEALTPTQQKRSLATFRNDASERGLRAILPW